MLIAKIKFLLLALNPEDATGFIGTAQLFKDMRDAGWIMQVGGPQSFFGPKRVVHYDRKDLEAACARYLAGEIPKLAREGTEDK